MPPKRDFDREQDERARRLTEMHPPVVHNLRGRDAYVPLSIRNSRIVSRLWRRGWFDYDTGRRLARWLP